MNRNLKNSKRSHSFTKKSFIQKKINKKCNIQKQYNYNPNIQQTHIPSSNPLNIDTPHFSTKDIQHQKDLSEFLELEKNELPIKISTLNIAGNLMSKLKSVLMYLWNYNIDIIILTETHFKNNIYER